MTTTSAQSLLDKFLKRDNDAVDKYNSDIQCLESSLHFVHGRLQDVTMLCVFLLEREIERERAMIDDQK